jgi:hypothetical protein
MGNMNLLVFSFDPSELVNYFVSPFIHALIPNMHLRIQNPEEAEPFGS